MPKIRQVFLTFHNVSPESKPQAIEFLNRFKTKLNWAIVCLEPYTDKDGQHLHVMYQHKNSVYPGPTRIKWVEYFKSKESDVWMEPGLGKFVDNLEYATNPYAGTHANDPKVVDTDPYFYPSRDFVEVELSARKSDSDSVIEDIRNGATFSQLLNTYPKYVLNNSSKIKKFMEDAKSCGFIRPDAFIIGGKVERVAAPWE